MVWTYSIQLRGTDHNSNIEILQTYQSKSSRSIVNASWFISNKAMHDDLSIPMFKEEPTEVK